MAILTTIICAHFLVAEGVQRETHEHSANPIAKPLRISQLFGLNVTHPAQAIAAGNLTAQPLKTLLRAPSLLGLNVTHVARLIPHIALLAFPTYEYMCLAHVVSLGKRVSGAISRKLKPDAPLIDTFLIVYWAVNLSLFWLLALWILGNRTGQVEDAEEKVENEGEQGEDKGPFHHAHTSVDNPHHANHANTPMVLVGGLSAAGKKHPSKVEDDEEGEGVFELDANTWALNYVAAIGQAQYKNGKLVTPGFTGAISFLQVLVQFAALGLMLSAINPAAQPWTTEPESPWLKGRSGRAVNLMKFLMTAFLVVGQIDEVSQSRRVLTVAFGNQSQYKKSWYWFIPILGAFAQYFVAISVVWCGVATILCFQTVPDIVYSSMSVLFLTSADELVADMVIKLLDIDANFEITLDKKSDGGIDDLFVKQPKELYLLLKFLQAFPAMLAGQLLLRAWYMGVMPPQLYLT